VLRDKFSYRPRINKKQFFQKGYAEAKCLFVIDVVKMIKEKLLDLNRNKLIFKANTHTHLDQGSTDNITLDLFQQTNNRAKRTPPSNITSALPINNKRTLPVPELKPIETTDEHEDDSLLYYNPSPKTRKQNTFTNTLKLFREGRNSDSFVEKTGAVINEDMSSSWQRRWEDTRKTSPWEGTRTPSPFQERFRDSTINSGVDSPIRSRQSLLDSPIKSRHDDDFDYYPEQSPTREVCDYYGSQRALSGSPTKSVRFDGNISDTDSKSSRHDIGRQSLSNESKRSFAKKQFSFSSSNGRHSVSPERTNKQWTLGKRNGNNQTRDTCGNDIRSFNSKDQCNDKNAFSPERSCDRRLFRPEDLTSQSNRQKSTDLHGFENSGTNNTRINTLEYQLSESRKDQTQLKNVIKTNKSVITLTQTVKDLQETILGLQSLFTKNDFDEERSFRSFRSNISTRSTLDFRLDNSPVVLFD
jgi:hypothetical protein